MAHYIGTKSTPLEILKYLMDENQISIRQLGNILGVDESHAGKIAKGTRGITEQNAYKLAKRFCLVPTAFVTPKAEKPKQSDKWMKAFQLQEKMVKQYKRLTTLLLRA